ncbi:MAG TPA: hypothetical protein PK513_04460 [Alphaproteobacteria bacterium]|nr:hypothetical protein [Alphaproteobacteria bacterium]USO05458.1 MAG: hypothetical protein H6859_10015 [Rhodospirillales bacterium]HOO81734.1 hypothetical protein [Alphaproteobacteria bacterium]
MPSQRTGHRHSVRDPRQAENPVRSAVDPVSGNTVNKAEAVIGAGPDKTVYYFENEENFQKYASGPMPEMSHDHGAMDETMHHH